MRYNLDITSDREDLIASLAVISDCVSIVERDSVCEGIVVEIPDDCDRKFDVEIVTVTGCRTVYTYQLCENNGECPDCEDCVNNFCTSTCVNKCVNGDCVECEGGDCPGDTTCIQGQCLCPPNTTRVGDICAITECPACHVYNPQTNTCDPLPCVDPNVLDNLDNCDIPPGYCNALTNTCSECVDSSQCGANQICVGGKCECASGYYFDEQTQECLPLPICTSELDCPDCTICQGGQCVPVICPEGMVCIGNNCVFTCNDDGDCPQGHICQDGICVIGEPPTDGCPSTPCSTPEDCNEGCGCIGVCTDCTQYSCDDTEDCPDGCFCNGGTCNGFDPDEPPVDNPDYCDSGCDSVLDCLPGCGCDGNDCVACNSVSCATNVDCPQGCFCNDGTCDNTENPTGCVETTCQSPQDCGENCGCQDGLCVPCASLNCDVSECEDVPGCTCTEAGDCVGDGDDECADLLTFTKGDCDLRANLITNSSCGCPAISLGAILNNITKVGNDYTLNVKLELRKGSAGTYPVFQTLPLLSQTLIVNDLPIVGAVRVRTDVTFREVNEDGFFISPTTISQNYGSQLLSFASTDTRNATFTGVPNVGDVRNIGGRTYKATRIEIRQTPEVNFAFPNTCKSKASVRVLYNYTQVGVLDTISPAGSVNVLNNTTLTRPPLLRVYGKASNATNLPIQANLIRGEYTTNIIVPQEELTHRHRYVVTSDCGCDPIKYHDCGNGSVEESAAVPLVFCKPTDFNYETFNCGRSVRILGDISTDCQVLINGPARYQLLANGAALLTEVNIQPTGLIIPGGSVFNSPTPINSLTLRIIGSACENCDVVRTAPIQPLEISTFDFPTLTCSTESTVNINVAVTNGTTPLTWELFRNNASIATGTSNNTFWTIPIDPIAGTYRIVVQDANGCTAELIQEAPIENIDLSTLFSVNMTCQGAFTVITVTSLTPDYDLGLTILGPSQTLTPAVNVSTTLEALGTYVIDDAPLLPESEYTFAVTLGDCPPFTLQQTVNCDDPSRIPNGLIVYTCTEGILLTPGFTYEIYNGSSWIPLNTGDVLTPGNKQIRISLLVSQRIVTFNVPVCYACQGVLCLPASPNQGFNNDQCGGQCTSPTPNPIEIDYSCETGLIIDYSVPAEVYLGPTLVGNGDIITPGNKTFLVIETGSGTQFNVQQAIPQCQVCSADVPGSDCPDIGECLFYTDVSDSMIVGGEFDGPVEITTFTVGGVNVIGSGIELTTNPISTPDQTVTLPVGYTAPTVEDVNTVWVDALNNLALDGFLFETTQFKHIYAITFPKCSDWEIVTTFTLPTGGGANYWEVTNSYNATTGVTTSSVEGFGTQSGLDPDERVYEQVGFSGALSLLSCTDPHNVFGQCINATPNLGICREDCADPQPEVCTDCVSTLAVYLTAPTVTGVRFTGTTDWLFQDLGGYDLSIASNVTRFQDDFAAAIVSNYPDSEFCFREVRAYTTISNNFQIEANCLCDTDLPTEWEIVNSGGSAVEMDIEQACPDFPLEGCQCFTSYFEGRFFETLLDSEGVDVLAGYAGSRITQFEASRIAIQDFLLNYYTQGSPACIPSISVEYFPLGLDGESASGTRITISCIDTDIYDAPAFAGRDDILAVFTNTECECTLDPCLTPAFSIEDFTIDYVCETGLTITPSGGFVFRYGDENGYLIDPTGTILLAGDDQTIWISDGECALTTTVDVPACFACEDGECVETANNEGVGICDPCSCKELAIDNIAIDCGLDRMQIYFTGTLPILWDTFQLDLIGSPTSLVITSGTTAPDNLFVDIPGAPTSGAGVLAITDTDGCEFFFNFNYSCACEDCGGTFYLPADRAVSILTDTGLQAAPAGLFGGCTVGGGDSFADQITKLSAFLDTGNTCANIGLTADCVTSSAANNPNSCASSNPLIEFTSSNTTRSVLGVFDTAGCFTPAAPEFQINSLTADCGTGSFSIEIENIPGGTYTGNILLSIIDSSGVLLSNGPLPIAEVAGTWSINEDFVGATYSEGFLTGKYIKVEKANGCASIIRVDSYAETNCP